MKNILLILLLASSNCLLSQLDYNSFKGEKSKISFNKEYTYSNIYDYRVNAKYEDSLMIRKYKINTPEGILSNKYSLELSENKKDSVVFEVILHSKLMVDINRERHCFIKYKTRKDNKSSDIKIVNLTKEKDTWRENTDTNNEIEKTKQVFLYTDVNMLFEFYNYFDNPNFPELNNLKPLVKESNGTLNIGKLYDVIMQNKATLNQYLEN